MTSMMSSFAAEGHISSSELLRAESEAAHHAENRVRAVRVVAGISDTVDDCRELLSILGLGTADIVMARDEIRQAHEDRSGTKPRRKKTAA